jgi:hypothetical protein
MKTTDRAMPKRIAASIVRVNRSMRRPPTAAQQQSLSLGRRLLAALLGIQVRPDLSRIGETIPDAAQHRGRWGTGIQHEQQNRRRGDREPGRRRRSDNSRSC